MLRFGNRQTIFPHGVKVQFDRFLDKRFDALARFGNSDAPGQIWNAGAPRSRTLFKKNGEFHLSLPFQSRPA